VICEEKIHITDLIFSSPITGLLMEMVLFFYAGSVTPVPGINLLHFSTTPIGSDTTRYCQKCRVLLDKKVMSDVYYMLGMIMRKVYYVRYDYE